MTAPLRGLTTLSRLRSPFFSFRNPASRPTPTPWTRTAVLSLGIGLWIIATWRTIDEHLLSLNPCEGASMLPTFAAEGEWLLTMKWPAFWAVERVRRVVGLEKEVGRGGYARTAGRPLKIGDLVFAIAPISGKQVCKRVLGLPGDTVLLDPRTRPLPRSAWLSSSSSSTSGSTSISALSKATPSSLSPSTPSSTSISAALKELLPPDDDRDEPTRQPDGTIGSIPTAATYVTVPKGHVFLCGDNLACSIDSRDYGPVPLALVKGRVVARIKPTAIDWLWKNLLGKVT
ncbi:unnamed protein product [Tilletia controversa]|uniref:Mitochondrial inner membrane protease subunit n=1 Tax=Tilletia controversa TaxID=13291 RepID=A0A8X7MU32_9BASI|nr:hypothetical protein CF336_g3541 [Tilletia laevis]KAE8200761.1 hypothetical protein CF328_g2868 [Tilletia controversa]KAE8247743.1 hypothetical protein A4X06_0g4224 [Tilletia controversa]CAD6896163.1 unnamed protein product [Tilletia laevis]CAD6926248.1 unnamed protein product [Tilletia controversa]